MDTEYLEGWIALCEFPHESGLINRRKIENETAGYHILQFGCYPARTMAEDCMTAVLVQVENFFSNVMSPLNGLKLTLGAYIRFPEMKKFQC